MKKARKMFETWFEIIRSGIKINAAKDVTRIKNFGIEFKVIEPHHSPMK